MYVGVTELLMAPGQYPGSSGTRNLHDNLSDLRAQVAANEKVYNYMFVMQGYHMQDVSHTLCMILNGPSNGPYAKLFKIIQNY